VSVFFGRKAFIACLLLARIRAFQRTLIGSAFFCSDHEAPMDSTFWKLSRNSGACAALFTGSRSGKAGQDGAMTRNST
jgi:hypothetical protein